jgi:adenylyl- and sulfurtransferase ThiI
MNNIKTIFKNLSQEKKRELAQRLEISLATLYRKMADIGSLTITQIRGIASFLHDEKINYTLNELHEEIVSRDQFN